MADEPIASIPGYRDLTVLGRGGSGVVYRAWQEDIDRFVAVKVLLGEFDESAARRFVREVRLTGRLTGHPHVVTVLDAGTTPSGQPFLVTDLYERGSLQDRLAGSGPVSPREVAAIGAKIAAALSEVHALGVVHRDVKPSNILVSRFGEPALADFGVAVAPASLSGVTAMNAFTPHHVAPETLSGVTPSAAADVYSLGSTLFHLLVGQPPFYAPDLDMRALLYRVVNDPPPVVKVPTLPGLAEVIGKALAKDPAERYQDAAEMAAVLRGLVGQEAVETLMPEPDPDEAAPAANARRAPWLTSEALPIPVTDDVRTASVSAQPIPDGEQRSSPSKLVLVCVGVAILVLVVAAVYLSQSSGQRQTQLRAQGVAGSATTPEATDPTTPATRAGALIPTSVSSAAAATVSINPRSSVSSASNAAAPGPLLRTAPTSNDPTRTPASSTAPPLPPVESTTPPAAPSTSAGYADCPSGELCIYHDLDGAGPMGAFSHGNYDLSVAPWGVLNDHVYSAWNNSSSTFCIYYDANYGGASTTIMPGDKSNLGSDFATNVSSLRLKPSSGC